MMGICAWRTKTLRDLALLAAMLQLCEVAFAQPPASTQISEVRIGLVDEHHLGADDLQLAANVGVRPFGDHFVVISRSPSGGALLELDQAGRVVWRHDFSAQALPQSLAVTGDSVAVLTGLYDEARVEFFQPGRTGSVRATALSLARGESAELLPAFFGKPLLSVIAAAVDSGGSRHALRTPRHELLSIAGQQTTTVLAYGDSSPRVLFRLATGTRPPSTLSVTPPWGWHPSDAAGGGNVYHASGYDFAIEVRRDNGELLRRVTVDATPVALSGELRQKLLDRWSATQYVGTLLPDSAVAMVKNLEAPPHLPMIAALHASADGGLAVVRADLGARFFPEVDSTFVDLFDAELSYRGRVAVPARMTLQAFTGTHLILSYTDGEPSRVVLEGRALPRVRIVSYRLSDAPRKTLRSPLTDRARKPAHR